ncbi:MAG: glycine--tRNA ligase subunit beta, partial [Pandoraea sp.]
KGYSANEIEAVLSQNPARMDDVLMRLEAVRAFSALPEAEALAAANKRIGNILRKAGEERESGGMAAIVDPALLNEDAERALAADVARIAPVVGERLSERAYGEALAALAQLRTAVDAFFNDVMVMADDSALRNNRLALLAQLHAQMNCVADISKLAA